ncbi:folylpolyglutamate synthase/dihydrofolate synthase family protein [Glutamicibacter protophormiae]|uniref:bifunctional folylpolyglutamate synthase/dihydrofolate synthase n=1 Tax=Glutamicibacter protophormiae TaxID=37930 RepID=UPI002A81E9FA|nr:folylpolyglutamate synthase/dihydrofolate synthase family protein [Glutamicibacter protophormiae]WPR66485.1 folylpolyglutamate synthase/dihydrofolate synthase family protein [Glutamicibacter protophormiae]WPR69981.1 folylpolyglutamate synthase/dihydrofolate synthase family protein [Glutamicibacter protophormiae]
MEPRMEPMFRAMEILGEPQKACPVIHITGTNGKTSTARMIESLLRAHDLRTGRYSSPHLVSVTERISVDGEPVADETFVRVWDEISPFLEIVDAELDERGETRLTYFEAVTILAFAVFAEAPVDVVVLEVGLGGITDATNVADGDVSVVTPISLDHTDLLGDTTELIAQEKVGILKPGGYLVSSVQPVDAADVLLARARELEVPMAFESLDFKLLDRQIAVGGQLLAIQGQAATYEEIFLPLFGAHQAQNAAVALAAVEAFLGGGERELNADLVREGFAETSSPGRLELVRTAPSILVDAGHNPDGIRVSAEAIRESFGFSRLVLMVGILQEKDAEAMLYTMREEYGDLVEDLCITQSSSPRAIPAGELANMALAAGWPEEDIHVTEDLEDAIEWSVGRAEAGNDLSGGVLVTGSITLVGEITTLLKGGA